MTSRARRWLRDLLPPVVARIVRRRRSPYGFRGNFAGWSAARAACEGYEAAAVMAATLGAAHAARDRVGAWDRDGWVFDEPAANWPVLGALLHAATESGGELRVVDVGGACGSVWWQHRAWLPRNRVKWAVVEQAHIVKAARPAFATEELSFHEDLAEAWSEVRPQVVLLAGVLQYLESPHVFLREVARREPRWIVMDRTGFLRSGSRDRLTVQWVREPLCRASYPCWFFVEDGMIRGDLEGYVRRAGWACDDRVDIEAEFRGGVFERAGTDRDR